MRKRNAVNQREELKNVKDKKSERRRRRRDDERQERRRMGRRRKVKRIIDGMQRKEE